MAFKNKDFVTAEAAWSSALTEIEAAAGTYEATCSSARELVVWLLTNRACCRLKLEAWNGVKADVTRVLVLDPGNKKALFCRSQAAQMTQSSAAPAPTAAVSPQCTTKECKHDVMKVQPGVADASANVVDVAEDEKLDGISRQPRSTAQELFVFTENSDVTANANSRRSTPDYDVVIEEQELNVTVSLPHVPGVSSNHYLRHFASLKLRFDRHSQHTTRRFYNQAPLIGHSRK
eukprot:SAG31_NODE_431_length_15775_cov_3.350663_15_plen_233_part_00